MRFIALLFIFSSLFSTEVDFEALFQKQLPTLNHLDVENPPLVLLFSGTPGMGKTTLSIQLEKTFKGIRIGIDDTRFFFKEANLTYEHLHDYMLWLTERITEISPNRLIILDLIIHPFFDDFMLFCDKHNTPYFMTRLEVPREIVEKRIVTRNNKPELTLERLDRNWKEYETFALNHTFDFTFDNTEENASITPLIESIIPLLNNR